MPSHTREVTRSQEKSACCTPKRAVYATAVTLVALAVILGALVVVSHHYANFRLPVVSSIAHQLGKYSFIPLVASGGLLFLLSGLGIYQKCTSKKEEIPRSVLANGRPILGSQSTPIVSNPGFEPGSGGQPPPYSSPARNSYYEQRPGNLESGATEPNDRPAQDNRGEAVPSEYSIIADQLERVELIAQLPKWLESYMTDVTCIRLPDRQVRFEDFEGIENPIALFSAGRTVGIHMRLQVNHECIEPSYGRAQENEEWARNGVTISSKKPFVLHVMAWLRYQNDDLWLLTTKTTYLEHRNAYFDAVNIFGDGRFSCRSSLSKEKIAQFLGTENQDDLSTRESHHLGWVLLRLLAVGHLKMREERTDTIFLSRDKPAAGYWQISIAGSQPSSSVSESESEPSSEGEDAAPEPQPSPNPVDVAPLLESRPEDPKAATKYHDGSDNYGPVRLIPNSSVYALGDATEKMQKQLIFALTSAPKTEGRQNFGTVSRRWEKKIDVKQIEDTGVASSQGERGSMEDAHLVRSFNINNTLARAWCVFDGHGDRGEAAQYAAQHFPEYLIEQLAGKDLSDVRIANGLTHVFCRLHQELSNMCENNKWLGGTCAICAVEIGGRIYVPNAGDSRAVLLSRRDREGLIPYQLSEDGVPNSSRFSQSIQKTGVFLLNGHDGLLRVGGVLACARGLGDQLLLPRPKITYIQGDGENAPEEGRLGYRQGDYLVIGCDGLFDVCSNRQLAQAVERMEQEGKETSEMARSLVEAAVVADCNDNVSVIVVRL